VHTAESLREARWFGGKNRPISATRIVDSACWTDGATLSLVEVSYAHGPSETYVLTEHFDDPSVGRALLRHFEGATLGTERGGRLVFRPTHVFHSIPTHRLEPVRVMRGEQSNTSLRFGDALILKLFRRLQFGPNPDVEIGWFLTEHTAFEGTPPVAGSLTYVSPEGEEAALVLLQQFEPNRGDAWTTTLTRVRGVLDGSDDIAHSLASIRALGATTAQLHVALASGTLEFAAERISAEDVHGWRQSLTTEIEVALDALAAHHVAVDSHALRERAAGLAALEGSFKTRHHGDYHLGQVLERDDGTCVIIDFEGEPSRPMAQRREKRSPLRDVAGMLRSFDYARHAALRSCADPADPARLRAANDWYHAARSVFLNVYLSTVRTGSGLVPDHIDAPLAALELEKAAYEVLYELNNRPDWLPIPLAAFSSG
jgi:maltose alpha-D-glucosyltransferase / alpha-amylase